MSERPSVFSIYTGKNLTTLIRARADRQPSFSPFSLFINVSACFLSGLSGCYPNRPLVLDGHGGHTPFRCVPCPAVCPGPVVRSVASGPVSASSLEEKGKGENQ
jgi:hypothetical protein